MRLNRELLKSENILRNFDEFSNFDKIISDRLMQDMKSIYVDIRDNIPKSDLSKLKNNDDILEAFYSFARVEKENKIESLIKQEKLKDKAHRFIEKSISKGYVEYAGEDLDKIIPPTSRRHGAREKKKASILEKIRQIVEVFVGI